MHYTFFNVLGSKCLSSDGASHTTFADAAVAAATAATAAVATATTMTRAYATTA